MNTKTLSLSNEYVKASAKVLLSVLALSLLAQIKFYLPLSPVPVTGQTFGVALLSLILGRKLAVTSVASYLAIGFAGLPVFAGLSAGFVGASSGYLVGMLAASYAVGGLSDLGAKKSFSKALASTCLGSFLIFSFGVAGLSFFVPQEELLLLGVFPFLAGDLVKNLLAATIATKFFNK